MLAVLILLVKLGARRLVNRLLARSAFGGKEKKRSGTGQRRGRVGALVMGFFALYMSFFVVMEATQVFDQLSSLSEILVPDRFAITEREWDRLRVAELTGTHADSRIGRRQLPDSIADRWDARLRANTTPADDLQRSAASPTLRFLPSAEFPPHPWTEPTLRRLLAIPLTGLVLFAILTSTGVGLGAGGQEDRSLEWLLTMPVRAGPLLVAEVLQRGVLSVTVSVVGTLALCSIGLCWRGGVGLVLGLIGAALLVCMVGAARVLVVIWARNRVPPSSLRNVGATAQVGALLVMFPSLGFVLMPERVPGAAYDAALRVGDVLMWTPFALPLHLFSEAAVPALVVTLVLCPLVVLGAARAGQHLLRNGVDGSRGEGRRAGVRSAAVRLGMARRELLLLVRDRNVLVQRLLLPIVLLLWIGFTVGADGLLTGETPVAAAGLFGGAAYGLVMCNMWTLASEGRGVWLLYTLPVEPGVLLRRRAALWTAVYTGLAVILAAGLLVARTARGAPSDVGDLSTWAFALLGLPLIGMLTGALGVLGVDPRRLQEADLNRRLRRSMPMVAFALLSVWTAMVYVERTWPRIALVVLYAALTMALWRRVRSRMSSLLDPTAPPERGIDLADGLMLSLVFLIGQGLILTPMLLVGIDRWAATFAGFVGAGGLAVVFALVAFRERAIGSLSAFLRLRDPSPRPELTGLLAAIPPAMIAVAWIGFLTSNPAMSELFGPSVLALPEARWWMIALAVIAAPLFEEFLFRGLVYRGFKRELPVRWAILASAAVFAVIHPASGSVPVFALGVAAAWAYERTGSLRAPIAAHMAYNAFVVGYDLIGS